MVDVTVPDALPDVVTVVPLVVVLVGPALVCVALVEDTVALLVTVTVSVLVWVVADVEDSVTTVTDDTVVPDTVAVVLLADTVEVSVVCVPDADSEEELLPGCHAAGNRCGFCCNCCLRRTAGFRAGGCHLFSASNMVIRPVASSYLFVLLSPTSTFCTLPSTTSNVILVVSS